MSDLPYRPDHLEDWIFLAVGALAILAVISLGTPIDGHARFIVRETAAYVAPPTEADLVFEREQIRFMREVSAGSVGTLGEVFADERLFCFTTTESRVTEVRLADQIDESSKTSVAGSCVSRFGRDITGFAHTHPGFSFDLSTEDKEIESAGVRYSCIIADELVVAPSGSVGGLKCWSVSGTGDDATFDEIVVGVTD